MCYIGSILTPSVHLHHRILESLRVIFWAFLSTFVLGQIYSFWKAWSMKQNGPSKDKIMDGAQHYKAHKHILKNTPFTAQKTKHYRSVCFFHHSKLHSSYQCESRTKSLSLFPITTILKATKHITTSYQSKIQQFSTQWRFQQSRYSSSSAFHHSSQPEPSQFRIQI